MDHHCVFFSKCIGKGNVNYFRLAIFGFILNMTYFMIVYGFIATSSNRHSKHLIL